jgi:MFS transporter, PAT family, beta-lactamase induction signal transducer AmpG
MVDSAGASNPKPGDWFQQALAVLGHRKTLAMLVFGFTAGLPNVLLIGTLNFWLAKSQVDLATIGVLSWIGLSYAFKFLWSPAMNLMPPFPFHLLGRRRGWILICQAIITVCIAVIATTDPTKGLGVLALAAAVAALASATQDISIDTWRIEEADKATPVDLLSAVYQFGYRSATLAGGAGALFLASVTSWNTTYMAAAGVFLIASLATLAAPESPIREAESAAAKTHRVGPKVRLFAVAAVLSASSFTQTYGPWIVAATVVFPCSLAAWLANTKITSSAGDVPAGFLATQGDRLYGAIVEPLVELMGRLGFAALIVLLVILSYRITDSIWGPFAGPFYLTELKYTEAEIALASKIWGVAMTIAGVALGAISLLWLGRMASVFIGAVAAAVTNLLYADLALGGVYVNAFLNGTGLMHLFGVFGLDDRMARLMAAIAGENVAAGFAGAAFVAYLSSLASRLHGAVQFAVFTSLTMLIGTLGRGALGDMIKSDGYAPVFVFTMWLGAIAIVACLIEWVRQARAEKAA